jgi:hypothetical protein
MITERVGPALRTARSRSVPGFTWPRKQPRALGDARADRHGTLTRWANHPSRGGFHTFWWSAIDGRGIDGLGGRLGELYVAAINDRHAQLLNWAGSFGRVHAFGIERTGSYGIGVGPVPAPSCHQGLRGRDPIDAENAAR